MSTLSSADQIVAEYLIYRGFTQTFRSLDQERKSDRTRQFEAQKIVESVFGYFHAMVRLLSTFL